MTWRVIQTKPAAEKRVEAGLRDEGLTAYLPLEVVWRNLRGRRIAWPRPLLRGYVFAHLADDELYRIHAVDGVVRCIGADGRAATIPAKFVDAIRNAEAAGEFDETREPERKTFRKGQRIRVARGEFVGLVGAIAKVKGSRRVAILLDTIGWQVAKSMDELDDEQPESPKVAA